MAHRDRERGAAAVEFALVLLPLLFLILGIIEFGYIFNQQLTITNAAREGARVLAITHDEGDAIAAAQATALTPGGTATVVIDDPCPITETDGDAAVIVSSAINTLTGLEFWVPGLDELVLSGRGVMPCGG